jgi:hypothetical protein
LADGKWLGDVEEAEEDEGDEAWIQSKGLKRRVMAWPATSSMTTNWGSLRPDSRATMVAAGMPRIRAKAMRGTGP